MSVASIGNNFVHEGQVHSRLLALANFGRGLIVAPSGECRWKSIDRKNICTLVSSVMTSEAGCGNEPDLHDLNLNVFQLYCLELCRNSRNIICNDMDSQFFRLKHGLRSWLGMLTGAYMLVVAWLIEADPAQEAPGRTLKAVELSLHLTLQWFNSYKFQYFEITAKLM